MKTSSKIVRNIQLIFRKAKQTGVSLSEEEIRVRFLYKQGLLFDLTIRQFAILSPWSERTVWRHRHKWGFHKVAGHTITNIANLRAVLSGERTHRGMPKRQKRGTAHP